MTADVDLAANVPGGVSAHHLQFVQGRMPASQGLTWPKGERKPPHFHVPFRAYPSAGGAPRGRSKGLDTIYDLRPGLAAGRPGRRYEYFTYLYCKEPTAHVTRLRCMYARPDTLHAQ